MSSLIVPRIAVASVWVYQGLWCKLLGHACHHQKIVETAPFLNSFWALVLPFVLAFFLFANAATPDHNAAAPAKGVAFALHVTLSILAYAAFGLSCVLSVIYLAQQRLLMRHHDQLGMHRAQSIGC